MASRTALVGCWAALLLFGGQASAQTTLVLQPDGVDGRDTFLSFPGDETNHGASERLAGYSYFERAALIWFDLSAIPASATCVSADLTMRYMFLETDVTAGRTWTVQELLASNAGWVEGVGNFGAGTLPGESDRLWRVSPSVPWTNGIPLSGFQAADADPSILATATVLAIPQVGDTVYFTLPCATVERWFGSPTQNPGLVLTVDETALGLAAHYLASSDHVDPMFRPRFSVTYVSQAPDGGAPPPDGGVPPPDGGVPPPDGGGGTGPLSPWRFEVGCGCQQLPASSAPFGAWAGFLWLVRPRRGLERKPSRLM
ncbi:MAG: hypothetical protein ACKVPX_03640 [Myxococcaceae bacterium]